MPAKIDIDLWLIGIELQGSAEDPERPGMVSVVQHMETQFVVGARLPGRFLYDVFPGHSFIVPYLITCERDRHEGRKQHPGQTCFHSIFVTYFRGKNKIGALTDITRAFTGSWIQTRTGSPSRTIVFSRRSMEGHCASCFRLTNAADGL